MGLQPEGPPDPADRGLAHPSRGRHRARRPMRRVRRLLLQGLHDHPLDLLIADLPRLTRTWLVMQTIDASLGEAPPPATNSLGAAAQASRDVLALLSISRCQHN